MSLYFCYPQWTFEPIGNILYGTKELSMAPSDYDFYQNRPKPKNHACATALIVRDEKVLMGLREYQKGSPLWTFPGGRCDFGEKPEDGLKREVVEEIGTTDLQIIRFLGKKEGAYRDESGIDEVHVFECSTKQEPRLLEPEKFLEWRWFGLDELPSNLIDQKDADFIRLVVSNRF